MTWESESQDEQSFGQFQLGRGMGYLLILCGLAVAVGIVLKIHDLFVDPQQLVVFKQLFSEQLTISWTDGLITIPSDMLAYLLPLFLLSMAVGIANSLIQAGVNLVRKRQNPGTN